MSYWFILAQEHTYSSALERLLNCEVPLWVLYIQVIFLVITQICY